MQPYKCYPINILSYKGVDELHVQRLFNGALTLDAITPVYNQICYLDFCCIKTAFIFSYQTNHYQIILAFCLHECKQPLAVTLLDTLSTTTKISSLSSFQLFFQYAPSA